MKHRYFLMLCVLFFVASMITFPGDVFAAAKAGLKAWWEIVFPALLPFFIAAELLMGFGIVHFMGVLLEPVMRPLFNVPGAGSFVLAVGFTSGFPISSHVTAQLRKDSLCTRIEAERLMSFTNNASPLFMLVAVSVGMFKNPELGLVIAGAHYLANLSIGFLLRFYGRHDREILPTGICSRDRLLQRAWWQLSSAMKKENRPAGKLLADAITNSVGKLLTIGGFVIVFAVIIRILSRVGILSGLNMLLAPLLEPLGLQPAAVQALTQGLFEVTLGTKAAAEAPVPYTQQIVAAAICLAWSGLSVHAQVASMISDTDIRMLPFIVSRFGQALLAALYSLLLLKPGPGTVSFLTRPVFSHLPVNNGFPTWLETFKFSLYAITGTLIVMVVLAASVLLIKSRIKFIRIKI